MAADRVSVACTRPSPLHATLDSLMAMLGLHFAEEDDEAQRFGAAYVAYRAQACRWP